MSTTADDPLRRLELLLQQASIALNSLMFPCGSSPQVETTSTPCKWSQLPGNYRKALNLAYGVFADDQSEQVNLNTGRRVLEDRQTR